MLALAHAHEQGRTGREQRAIDTSKDNFFASIVAEQPKVYSHRSRRQSRATRENVIEAVIATGAYMRRSVTVLLAHGHVHGTS